jgi:ketosteroid isomerase-like protein
MSLYEAQATLLAQPGEAPAKGTEEIRAALQAFLATEPMFTNQVRQVFEADNLPLSFPDWTLTGTGPNGEAIEMSGQTSDVLR